MSGPIPTPGRRRALAALRGRRDLWPLGLALVLVLGCLANPSLPVSRPQLDAVVVLDITQSMLVPDQTLAGRPVSRLAYAKASFEAALDRLPCGARIGWGLFTEYRSLLLLTPLEVCEHQAELRDALRGIDTRMAWVSASEVAKGLNGGRDAMRALDEHPALVFVTDGHESPPVNPRYRPNMTVPRGEGRGLIVGVGGDRPLPIPLIDPEGHIVGEWAADAVMQVDPRSLGRGGSVAGEQMADDDGPPVAPLPGAMPGREHLSSLREGYLQLLARETGLGYLRLTDADALVDALAAPALQQQAPARLDLRPVLGGLALLLLGVALGPWRRRAVAVA